MAESHDRQAMLLPEEGGRSSHRYLSDQQRMKIKAEIQFRLSRLSMAEMHYAIDKVTDLTIVYPDMEPVPKIPWSPSSQWCADLDTNLNPKQREAIIAITTPLNIQLPPILIHGPYGTGKTYTLGKAIEQLLKKAL